VRGVLVEQAVLAQIPSIQMVYLLMQVAGLLLRVRGSIYLTSPIEQYECAY
jgi:hypothetical protein